MHALTLITVGDVISCTGSEPLLKQPKYAHAVLAPQVLPYGSTFPLQLAPIDVPTVTLVPEDAVNWEVDHPGGSAPQSCALPLSMKVTVVGNDAAAGVFE